MRFTRVQINANYAITLLFLLAVTALIAGLVTKNDGATHIAGVAIGYLGGVADRFSKTPNGNGGSGNGHS